MPNPSEGSTLKADFEKVVYPDSRVEVAVPITAELKYSGEHPTSFEVSDKEFPVECYEKEFTARDFFSNTVRRKEDGSIESITFYNPVARKYVRDLMGFFIRDNIREISQTLATDLQMESSELPGKYEGSLQQKFDKQYTKGVMKAIRLGFPYRDEGKVATIVRGALETETPQLPNVGNIPMLGENWFSDKQEEILEWINELIEQDVMIRDTILKVKTGEGEIKVFRTTIGALEGPPENKYTVEQDVLKTMFFCKEKLKFPLRKKLEIFDTAVFTESQDGKFKPETNRFMDAGGISYGSKIYINTSADREITSIVDTPEGGTLVSGAKLVNRREQSDIASHEIVHFMDVSSYTRPQREGLATAVEWGFDFDISLRRLRYYNNAITPDRVKMLMSSEPPSNLTLTEVYSVSASFFCWLYKELGSENFATFYDRISGAAGKRYEKNSIQHQLLGPIDSAPELSWRGNLEKTLDSLPHDYHWTWGTSDDLLANFVSDVEKRKKR